MAKTIRNELKDKFFKLGGTQEEVPNDLTIRSMQKAIYLKEGGEQTDLTNDSQTIQGMVKAENGITE
jgi:hypothetical protein